MQTVSLADSETDWHTYMHTYRQLDWRTCMHLIRPSDRQTNLKQYASTVQAKVISIVNLTLHAQLRRPNVECRTFPKSKVSKHYFTKPSNSQAMLCRNIGELCQLHSVSNPQMTPKLNHFHRTVNSKQHLMNLNVFGEACTCTLSASCTSQIFFPVHGLFVGKVRPLLLSTHSLLMNNWKTNMYNSFILINHQLRILIF